MERKLEDMSKQLKETKGENMLKNAIYVVDKANQRREMMEQENEEKEHQSKLKKEPNSGAQNPKHHQRDIFYPFCYLYKSPVHWCQYLNEWVNIDFQNLVILHRSQYGRSKDYIIQQQGWL